jgi:outer membrane protein insertion porin family
LGWVIPYGRTDEVPYYEAFELGGRNSMRGYPERSIGPVALGAWRFGDFLLNLNFELRSPYYRRLSGVLFFDLGSLSSGPAALFSNDYYGYSAGLGVRISTPIGPLRFDYGKRLRAPMPKDWGAIYFGLLQAF